MNLYEERQFTERQLEDLYACIDESMATIMSLAERPDPAGMRIHRARQLLREIDKNLLMLQETDHRLQWSEEKISLIDSCLHTGPDAIQ